jgi:carbon monoxide dehydrogenase subunit G
MADSIGPFKAQFNLDITVQETRPQELIRVRASGEDKRLGTSQQMDVTIALSPLGPRETMLDVTADVQILGKIATLGQFAIKRKAKDVVQQFARNIAAELQPRAARGSDA